MLTDGIEKEVLGEIAKRLVVKKEELVDFLKDRVENPVSVVEAVTKSLNDKGLITYVSAIGQSCYAVTQRGMREIG